MLLQSLTLASQRREQQTGGASLTVSVLLHVLLAGLVVLVPLLSSETVPVRDAAEIFSLPLALAAPSPPPPPPPPARPGIRHEAPSTPAAAFTVPVDVSSAIEPDALDLGSAGDVDGVEGGVPDGLVGAVVAGLPPAAPPPPPRVVRVSSFAAPHLLRKIAPTYPELALKARVSGVVVVEAQVDTRGNVATMRVLSGHPLLEAAALDAIRQWRYQPLLLGGEPTAFIVTVSVTFSF